MTELHRALQALWADFGLPAYTGALPEGAPLPRLHYTVISPPFAAPGMVSAAAWFSGTDAALLRDAFADTLRAAFPEEGRMLRFPGGCAAIYRAGDFLTHESDPEDPALRGVRIRLDIRLYAP